MTSRAPKLIVAIGALLLVAHLAAMQVFRKPDGRIVVGDATHHFVQLRSIVFDRDVHFQNEYTRIYALTGPTPGTEWVTSDHTVTGHVRNYMPVGPALLWMPLYLIVTAAQALASLLGLAAPPDGYGRGLQMVPAVSGVIASTLAAWLTWRTTRRYTDDASALAGVIGVWLGSHAIYYSLVSPAYSHAASMLATSWFVHRWLSTRATPTIGRVASWGALAGVAALMRWQDAMFVMIVAIEVLLWRAPGRVRLTALALAAAAFLLVFSPQMVMWNTLYGQPFAIPQGPAFMQWTDPHLWDVLLSTYHGLFTWTPMLLLALVGLVGWARATPGVGWAIGWIVVVSWYVNGAVADWWAGEAYGSRRFLSLFPFFVLGLGWWIGRQKRTPSRSALAVVAALIVANGLLLLQYQLFMKGLRDIAPYPGGFVDMYLERFMVPARLVRWWLGIDG